MKEIGRFKIFDQSTTQELDSDDCYVPVDLFEELSRLKAAKECIWPGGYRLLEFGCDTTDPNFQAAWRILADNGYGPTERKIFAPKTPKQFYYVIQRQFSEEDLASAPYLNVALVNTFGDDASRYPPDYQIVAIRKTLLRTGNAKRKVGCVFSSQWMVVRASVRSEMEKAGFDVEFREIVDESRQVIPDFFDMTTPKQLPPLRDIRIVSGVPIDGFYGEPQLKFEKSAFEALGPFDFALTQEHFDAPESMSHRMNVCSQRLFQFLRKYDKNLTAIPIKLV